MNQQFPEHLSSTATMLHSAYPDGIPSADYFPLLRLLYEEMSDRNLALVVGGLIDKGAVEVLNDVYRCVRSVRWKDLHQIRRVLSPHGYSKWLKEDL